jgi:hypothetical protein
MHKIQTVLALTGITLGLAMTPAMAQDKMPDKMGKMDKMDHMSKEEKAAMFNKMSDADKAKATKMAGHDMSKMSAHDRMAATDKMSVDDKAMMYDKMAASHKMDKMDKAAMDKAEADHMKK